MIGYSEVNLLGNLVKDPELKSFDNSVVCNNTIAINSRGRDGDTTTFVDVAFWNKNAEVLKQFGKKGSPLFITGRLKVATYEKDGEKKVQYSVIVNDFRFLSYTREGDPDPILPEKRQRRATRQQVEPSTGGDIPF